jgi:hypothetical protein
MVMIKEDGFEKPFVLDILKVSSEKENQYDVPFYFMGQVMKTNFEYDTPPTLSALGTKNGYQHLYLEGIGKPSSDNTQLLWMGNGKFYSLTSATHSTDELLFTRLGANDPEFNLRKDAALMIRRKSAANTVFASVLEPHGNYSPVSEFAVNSNSNISELTVVYDDEAYTAVSIQDLAGKTRLFVLSNNEASASAQHHLKIDDEEYHWTGPYHYTEINSL